MTAPEQLVATLARKWKVDIVTATSPGPPPVVTWTPVRAIRQVAPGGDPNMEDDSDYDGDGWTSEVKTAQAWTLELTLIRKVGLTSNTYDPGQEKLRLAAFEFGAANIVHVRWYDRNGLPEAYEGFASVSWAEEAGEPTALSTATATLSGQGKRTNITNPTPPAGAAAAEGQPDDLDPSTAVADPPDDAAEPAGATVTGGH
jgi:hypothetical protein